MPKFERLDETRRARRAPTRGTTGEEVAVEEIPADTENAEKLKAELDGLLDEIDEVLETNAEDFVRSYVQRGGE